MPTDDVDLSFLELDVGKRRYASPVSVVAEFQRASWSRWHAGRDSNALALDGRTRRLAVAPLQARYSRSTSRKLGERTVNRSLAPLPCSTRITIRLESMSTQRSLTISLERNPAE